MGVALKGSWSVGNLLQCRKTEVEPKIRKVIKEDLWEEVGLALRHTARLKGKGGTGEKKYQYVRFSHSLRGEITRLKAEKNTLGIPAPGSRDLLKHLHPSGVSCTPRQGCWVSVATWNGVRFEPH